ALLGVAGTPIDQRVPRCGELLELRLVILALGFDWSARALEATFPFSGRGAGRSEGAHFVELFVQRKYFLEERGRRFAGAGRAGGPRRSGRRCLARLRQPAFDSLQVLEP